MNKDNIDYFDEPPLELKLIFDDDSYDIIGTDIIETDVSKDSKNFTINKEKNYKRSEIVFFVILCIVCLIIYYKLIKNTK